MMENNKKLLAKIQQLENMQTEAKTQLEALEQENARLETEAEDLNSTISSQTSLIIGLRSTVQRLNVRDILIQFHTLTNRGFAVAFSRVTRSLSKVFARAWSVVKVTWML